MPRDQSSADLRSRIADAQYELIPIDHGFCLPETLEAPYFEWLHWPQAMLPFSEEELAYIQRIDIEVSAHFAGDLSRPWLHRCLSMDMRRHASCAVFGVGGCSPPCACVLECARVWCLLGCLKEARRWVCPQAGVHESTHAHACTNMHMHTCTRTYARPHADTHTYTCTRTRTRTCTPTLTCPHTHMHTG